MSALGVKRQKQRKINKARHNKSVVRDPNFGISNTAVKGRVPEKNVLRQIVEDRML
jgi:hypothetical protein